MAKPKPISLIDLITTNRTSEARKLVEKYGEPRARSMSELRISMARIMRRNPKGIRSDIASIHPHNFLFGKSSVTGWQNDPDYSYNNACGCGNFACDGKCDRCMSKKVDDTHSNFVTNFRVPGNEADADGTSSGETRPPAGKAKETGQKVLIVAAVFLLGVLLISQGEKHRAY